MNGKKRKNKKLVLDSGKVNHYPEVAAASNYLNINNLIFIILYFQKNKKKNKKRMNLKKKIHSIFSISFI